jgi:hypothetical protein
MIFAALVLPTATLPKARVAGENVTGASPVPVRPTSCGEFVALSLIVIPPVMAPVAVGVNVAIIVQVAPAFNVLPHVFVWPKSPLTVIAIAVLAVPVFFTVIILLALVLPTAVEVKASLAGVAVTVVDDDVPVPERLTD